MYYLHTRDARLEPILQRQAAFFCTQLKLAAGYELSGAPLVSYGATSFLGPVWTLFQVLPGSWRISSNTSMPVADAGSDAFH